MNDASRDLATAALHLAAMGATAFVGAHLGGIFGGYLEGAATASGLIVMLGTLRMAGGHAEARNHVLPEAMPA